MTAGRMTPNLLSRFVGDPAAPTTTPQLVDIPMWWTLFSADALVAVDPLAVEIHGGAFSRPVLVGWSAYGVTGLVQADEARFSAIPVGAHVACVGLMDAETNGNLLAADLLRDVDGVLAPIDFPTGGNWILPAGEFFLGFDLTGL